ncbi:MAG TPA: ABC transporter substrate-binding protein [Aggregatilineales bacterium]|nr:ABC transporter substrate-binding protein [Aggregatilineales bacterium]
MAKLTRRRFLGLSAAGMAGSMLAPRMLALAQTAAPTPAPTAAATLSPLPPAPPAGPIDLKAAGGMDALVAAAQKEGALTTITLPRDWADYGEIMDTFQAKYNIKITDLIPDGSSGQEIDAIRANAGSTGTQAPDVIDVGFKWGEVAVGQGLLQPYKVATWDTIPDSLKSKDGFYYGNYQGTMSIAMNLDALKKAGVPVPADWADLLNPAYKKMISISDPTQASEAAHGVWAAAIGNGGSLDNVKPGIEFFAKLAKLGNLAGAKPASDKLGTGELPIQLAWDFNTLNWRDANKDNANIQVIYPKSGTISTTYLDAINAYSPRPNASRLWMEYVYSDAGQLMFLKGYAKPVRFDDLSKRKLIPDDLLAKLPKADVPVAVPTLDQINAALIAIADGWKATVEPAMQQ